MVLADGLSVPVVELLVWVSEPVLPTVEVTVGDSVFVLLLVEVGVCNGDSVGLGVRTVPKQKTSVEALCDALNVAHSSQDVLLSKPGFSEGYVKVHARTLTTYFGLRSIFRRPNIQRNQTAQRCKYILREIPQCIVVERSASTKACVCNSIGYKSRNFKTHK
eukprot:gb/GECG01001675.1/.p1 GENE.gb/GECG01001675.1/~~gb/GECG01001675.1/.p1  ORF type:complete len:162 (+),score=5.37 gb/GECG01001675.1/:1-486(+)